MVEVPAHSVDDLLGALWEAGGTDLLLTVGATPLVRADGELRPISGTGPLTPADTERIAAELLSKRRQVAFEQGSDIDFSLLAGPGTNTGQRLSAARPGGAA